MYTYPEAPARTGSDLSTVEVHQIMKNPNVLRKRLQALAAQKFISDFLLPQRFQAVGGSLLYETGEEIFPDDDPEAITPGGAYPQSTLTGGELASVKTTKWGRDYPVTDEAISRLNISPVDRALNKAANGMIRFVDSVALSVIASKVTSTYAGGAWTEAAQIIDNVLVAKAKHEEDTVGEGYDLDVVVLRPTQYAKVMSILLSDGALPREATNPINSGSFPNYLGLTWTTSTHVPFTDPFLVDTKVLGGMADEKIESPGYSGKDGIEVKSIRDEDHDGYRVRGRRVTVPVVVEPLAGVRVTGTGVGQ